MIGSQGSVVRPHGNCLSLPTQPHTEGFHHCFSLHLPILHTAAQHPLTLMASALHRTSTCMWRFVGHLPSWRFAVVQLFSHAWLFVTPWTAACQASLCDPMDCSILGFPVLHHLPELAQTMSIELVIASNRLILSHPLLHLPSIFPSIRVFSNESALYIRYWNFSVSISPSNEYSGLISFRIDWFNLLAVQEILKSLFQHCSSKSINSSGLSLLYGPAFTAIHDYWKNWASNA